MDFDGAGIHLESRAIILNEESLWKQAIGVKDDLKKSLDYINFIAYSDVPLLGDLKSEWDIRFHSKLLFTMSKLSLGEMLTQIETMVESDLEVLLFYLTLVARGILFLHKFIGTNPKFQNWT